MKSKIVTCTHAHMHAHMHARTHARTHACTTHILIPCKQAVDVFYMPYSGFLSREKTFMNCLKIDFRRENFREFVVTQCTTPTSTVSNCLKIDFRRENFRESSQKREIRKSFLLRKKPAIRYIIVSGCRCVLYTLLFLTVFFFEICIILSGDSLNK